MYYEKNCFDVLPDGATCTTGSQCCSGTCVNGLCRPCSVSYLGASCSDDSNSYQNDGICTSNGLGTYYCDKTEATSGFFDDCYNAGNTAWDVSPYGCDTVLAGGYSAVGVCALFDPDNDPPRSTTHVNCDTDEVCVYNSKTYFDCSLCTFGSPCDNDVSDGYQATGTCDGNDCVIPTCQDEGEVMTTSCCSGLVEDTYTGSNRCCPSGEFWSNIIGECTPPEESCSSPLEVFGVNACCPDSVSINGVSYLGLELITIVYG